MMSVSAHLKGLVVLAVVLLLAVVFVLDPNNFRSVAIKQLSSTRVVNQEEIPVGLDVLKNKAVTIWAGGVDGRLIAKNSESLTVEDSKGNSITISVDRDPKGTKFFNETSTANPPGPAQYISLEEIPIGAHIRGQFFVIPQGGDKNRIVGSYFTYLDKTSKIITP